MRLRGGFNMKLLTKVAKGVAFGDVSNQAVRNILTELSKKLYGGITEQEMYDTIAAKVIVCNGGCVK